MLKQIARKHAVSATLLALVTPAALAFTPLGTDPEPGVVHTILFLLGLASTHGFPENARGEDYPGTRSTFAARRAHFPQPVQAWSGRQSDGHNDHAADVFNLCPIPPPPAGSGRQGMRDEGQPVPALV